jgi:hypothetical protein
VKRAATGLPGSIYVTGADGVGKTTQADRLEARLRDLGDRPVRRVWLRFPVLVSAPLLAYARLAGLTRYERVAGRRVGVWRFAGSKLMTSVFPWAQWLDTLVFSLPRVSWPLMRGNRLLIERHAIDVLVDLMTALEDPMLPERPVGRRLLALVPRNTRVVILDAPYETVRARRQELEADPMLEARLLAFRALAALLGHPLVNADQAPELVERALWAEVRSGVTLTTDLEGITS